MKYWFIAISCLLFYSSSLGQTDSTVYYFEEVGMFIKVPPKFEIVNAAEDDKLKQKGVKVLEDANNVEVDASSTINLLSIRQGQFNYLNITATPYKQASKNSWENDNAGVKQMVYKSFVDKAGSKNIDTTSSIVEIDGLRMDKFLMTVRITSSMTMRFILLAKYYKGYDFGICYVFIDDTIGQEIQQVIESSSFKK